MKLEFFKYQGTGNDFVIIDDRKGHFPEKDHNMIANLCDRKFGIGADGLMLVQNSDDFDFKMVYFNADGFPGSMCGNGGRCIVAFAQSLGICDRDVRFEALGEEYLARIEEDEIRLYMPDVEEIEIFPEHVFLDTGSPHHVTYTEDVNELDVFEVGRRIRYGEPYGETGTNVNFVQQIDDGTFAVRTYERGVENETLSCGTGVTAVALASFRIEKTRDKQVRILTSGGDLQVDFDYSEGRFSNIALRGPATFVFKGMIEV